MLKYEKKYKKSYLIRNIIKKEELKWFKGFVDYEFKLKCSRTIFGKKENFEKEKNELYEIQLDFSNKEVDHENHLLIDEKIKLMLKEKYREETIFAYSRSGMCGTTRIYFKSSEINKNEVKKELKKITELTERKYCK